MSLSSDSRLLRKDISDLLWESLHAAMASSGIGEYVAKLTKLELEHQKVDDMLQRAVQAAVQDPKFKKALLRRVDEAVTRSMQDLLDGDMGQKLADDVRAVVEKQWDDRVSKAAHDVLTRKLGDIADRIAKA